MVRPIRGGFRSDEHAAAFKAAARTLGGFGGPAMPTCGARTRNGGTCNHPALKGGNGRCLGHAGPHAARLYRERQRKAFMSGRISAEVWNKAEARRQATLTGNRWRKRPWLPGSTIELDAPDEADLRADLAQRGVDVDNLAPSVADWLRWKYRRTQIDRRDDGRWLKVVLDLLPERIRRAGPRPVQGEAEAGTEGRQAGAVGRAEGVRWRPLPWAMDRAGSEAGAPSKRALPDRPKAPPVLRGKGYKRPGRPRTQPASEDEMTELMEVYRANAALAGPMLDRCPADGERLAVLRALRDFVQKPDDRRAREGWMAMVARFRPT